MELKNTKNFLLLNVVFKKIICVVLFRSYKIIRRSAASRRSYFVQPCRDSISTTNMCFPLTHTTSVSHSCVRSSIPCSCFQEVSSLWLLDGCGQRGSLFFCRTDETFPSRMQLQAFMSQFVHTSVLYQWELCLHILRTFLVVVVLLQTLLSLNHTELWVLYLGCKKWVLVFLGRVASFLRTPCHLHENISNEHH